MQGTLAERLEELFEQPGFACRPLSRKERWNVLQQWREVFAAPLHRRTGRWKHGQFEWHVFSYAMEFDRMLKGLKAREALLEESTTAYYVVPEDEKRSPAYFCTADRPLDLSPLADDMLLWPQSCDWTMAFTHEQDIGSGPYFCRREWVRGE